MENKNNEEEWEDYNPIFPFKEHDIEDDSEIKRDITEIEQN
jgi:hypothetical protein